MGVGNGPPARRRRLTAGCLCTGVVGAVIVAVTTASLWRTLGQQAASTERKTARNDPEYWNNTAWAVVRSPRENPGAYAQALRQAVAAVQAEPNNGYYINTLGVAQYRGGQYADALATLTKSEKLNTTKEGAHPADLAFLAMAQYQLGQKEEAKATLDRLREVLMHPRWFRIAESRSFLQEAEELIEGEPVDQTTKDTKNTKNGKEGD
jgi:tetratricopeptide (TPR) repeat protein